MFYDNLINLGITNADLKEKYGLSNQQIYNWSHRSDPPFYVQTILLKLIVLESEVTIMKGRQQLQQ